MKKDIKEYEDVQLLVNTFYQNVLEDSLLAPIFIQHLEGKWEEHHEKLARFWHTVLFREMRYYGRPQDTHEKLEVAREHFDRWIEIWKLTVDSLYEGEIAEKAKYRGTTMADSFFKRLEK